MYLLPSTHKQTYTNMYIHTDIHSDSAYIAAVADIFHK